MPSHYIVLITKETSNQFKSIEECHFIYKHIERVDIYITMWSCSGNMPNYYPGLRDILPSPSR